jgi:hypothetical protein
MPSKPTLIEGSRCISPTCEEVSTAGCDVIEESAGYVAMPHARQVKV